MLGNVARRVTGDLTRLAGKVQPCRRIDGRPVYAATDLVAYLACEHLTQLERAALAGLVKRPMRDDPELDIIRKRGFEHEARYLADLQAEGRTAVTIELDGSIEDAATSCGPPRPRRSRRWPPAPTSSTRRRSSTARGAATRTSCCASTTRIARRVWGPCHYEVADTKLARHVKASAVLQICTLRRPAGAVQGVRPEWMHVALGGSARAVERLRVDDYMAYYRSARDRFLATMADEVAADLPAGDHVSRAGRALRRLPLGGRMRRTPSRATTT